MTLLLFLCHGLNISELLPLLLQDSPSSSPCAHRLMTIDENWDTAAPCSPSGSHRRRHHHANTQHEDNNNVSDSDNSDSEEDDSDESDSGASIDSDEEKDLFSNKKSISGDSISEELELKEVRHSLQTPSRVDEPNSNENNQCQGSVNRNYSILSLTQQSSQSHSLPINDHSQSQSQPINDHSQSHSQPINDQSQSHSQPINDHSQLHSQAIKSQSHSQPINEHSQSHSQPINDQLQPHSEPINDQSHRLPESEKSPSHNGPVSDQSSPASQIALAKPCASHMIPAAQYVLQSVSLKNHLAINNITSSYLNKLVRSPEQALEVHVTKPTNSPFIVSTVNVCSGKTEAQTNCSIESTAALPGEIKHTNVSRKGSVKSSSIVSVSKNIYVPVASVASRVVASVVHPVSSASARPVPQPTKTIGSIAISHPIASATTKFTFSQKLLPTPIFTNTKVSTTNKSSIITQSLSVSKPLLNTPVSNVSSYIATDKLSKNNFNTGVINNKLLHDSNKICTTSVVATRTTTTIGISAPAVAKSHSCVATNDKSAKLSSLSRAPLHSTNTKGITKQSVSSASGEVESTCRENINKKEKISAVVTSRTPASFRLNTITSNRNLSKSPVRSQASLSSNTSTIAVTNSKMTTIPPNKFSNCAPRTSVINNKDRKIIGNCVDNSSRLNKVAIKAPGLATNKSVCKPIKDCVSSAVNKTSQSTTNVITSRVTTCTSNCVSNGLTSKRSSSNSHSNNSSTTNVIASSVTTCTFNSVSNGLTSKCSSSNSHSNTPPTPVNKAFTSASHNSTSVRNVNENGSNSDSESEVGCEILGYNSFVLLFVEFACPQVIQMALVHFV